MEYIHDNKPPLSSGNSSIFVDIVVWNPKDKDTRPLVAFLENHGLGERSQTVEWLNKFTIRLSMWKGQYWTFLPEADWSQASQDLIQFIQDMKDHYQPKRIEYDTRAFSVGLAKKVRREKRAIQDLASAPPTKNGPVWWIFS